MSKGERMRKRKWSFLTYLVAALVISYAMRVEPARAATEANEIALEEVEFTVTDNGQVKDRKFMRELEAQELGRQMRKNGLPSGRRLSARKLLNPKLRFLDKMGKTTKEIELGEVVGKTRGKVDASTESVNVEANISRHGSVSGDKRSAVVVETRGEPMSGSHGEATSEVAVYDAGGSVRWTKKLPHLKIATAWKMADDGSRLIILQGATKTNALKDGEPREQIVAFDSAGGELLRFPRTGREYALDSPIAFSPNGRFVAIRARKDRKEITLLLDLEGQKIGEIQKPSFPISVDDTGWLKLGLMSGSKYEEVDGKSLMKSIP